MSALLLSRAEVERLLTPELCIGAVEDAFRILAAGKVPPPGILGMHAADGGFHVKAGFLALDRPYFAAKLNANFPRNGERHGLPTIQGAVLLSDASNGTPLALMDSMSITALRTAAATAVAAQRLARAQCETALIVGCGGQAGAQLRALFAVRSLRRVLAFDRDPAKASALAAALRDEQAVRVEPVRDLAPAARESDIIVTCTTSTRYFLTRDMVRPGTFVGAVGADSEDKQEIEPALMAAAKVVTDVTAQAASIGDLHHALAAGTMSLQRVHAELGELVSGAKSGRADDEEITIFDSTGTGLQDVAAAIAVYRKAVEAGAGMPFDFSGRKSA